MLGLHFCVRAFSSCGEWGPLFIMVHGPLIVVASLVVEHKLQMRRLSSCGSQGQLRLTGPVAPRHVGSSQTRARTRVPCISRQILNHCAIREAPSLHFLFVQKIKKISQDERLGLSQIFPGYVRSLICACLNPQEYVGGFQSLPLWASPYLSVLASLLFAPTCITISENCHLNNCFWLFATNTQWIVFLSI